MTTHNMSLTQVFADSTSTQHHIHKQGPVNATRHGLLTTNITGSQLCNINDTLITLLFKKKNNVYVRVSENVFK